MHEDACRVIVSPTFVAQFEAADQWWRIHRPAAPRLLSIELTTGLGRLSQQPRLGRRTESSLFGSVRVLLLRRSGYNVYYQVDEAAREVRVVYFRHARRRPAKTR